MWLDLLISIACIATFLVAIEWATIRYTIPAKHSRKIVHFVTSLLVIGVALMFGWRIFIPLGLLFLVVLFAIRVIHPLESIRDRSGQSIGEILFPLGVAVAAYICQDIQSFIAVVLVLGISDTLAFYIGRAIKSPKLILQKTLIGSLCFLVSAFIIGMFFLPTTAAIIFACTTTLAESLSSRGFDNLTVPIVGAMTIALL